MSNKLWINRETLEGIANAIRSKKGTTDLIPVPELESEILSIVGGDSSWCGEYEDGANYTTGAIVSFEGNIYLCIKDLDDQQDPTNTEYWEMLNEPNEWRGVYEDGVAYKVNEYVDYDGNVYICIENTDGTQNPTNTEYWARVNKLPKTCGIEVTPTKDIQNIVPEDDYDGFDEVIVHPIPDEYVIPNLQEKTATENGEVTADEGYTGLSKVTVNVPSEEPNLISKTITENGTYKASEEVDDSTIVGTWLLNSTVQPAPRASYSLEGECEFTGSGTVYNIKGDITLYVDNFSTSRYCEISAANQSNYVKCSLSGWYRCHPSTTTTYASSQPILTVTGGTDADNETLKDWLNANGRKISGGTVDGYSEVIVNVEPALEEKTVTPTTEEQVIVASDGYVGMSKVTVNPIPSEYIVPSGETEITENGTYDVKNYESVSVNVENSGGGGGITLTAVKPSITFATEIPIDTEALNVSVALTAISNLIITQGE